MNESHTPSPCRQLAVVGRGGDVFLQASCSGCSPSRHGGPASGAEQNSAHSVGPAPGEAHT